MVRFGAESREASRALSVRSEGATGFGQSEPVASAQRDEPDPEHGVIDIGPEDDGDGHVPPTGPHQPTLERPLESTARMRALGEPSQERIDLVQAPLGGTEIAADLKDVVDDAVDVRLDERVTDLPQRVRAQGRSPRRSFTKRSRAPRVTSPSSPSGNHWSNDSARRRSTSAANGSAWRSRPVLARTSSPDTAALIVGYSPASTGAWAQSNAVSLKLTDCLRAGMASSPRCSGGIPCAARHTKQGRAPPSRSR